MILILKKTLVFVCLFQEIVVSLPTQKEKNIVLVNEKDNDDMPRDADGGHDGGGEEEGEGGGSVAGRDGDRGVVQ